MTFEIEDAKRLSAKLRWDDLDFSAFEDEPLRPDALRCVRYMHDVEFHTSCYLRDLLLGPAHHDPNLTSFLSIWAFEELWHGEALASVLAAHGEPSGSSRVGPMRDRLGVADRIRPLAMLAGTWTIGSDLVALQMAWGAVNEMTTQAGYALLASNADNPVLTRLLKRIMLQEGRHISFYASQARTRLASSRKARRVTRSALRHLWSPVGSKVMPRRETQHLSRYLFAGPGGARAAERIDMKVGRLPGLAGLSLLQNWFSPLPVSDEFPVPTGSNPLP